MISRFSQEVCAGILEDGWREGISFVSMRSPDYESFGVVQFLTAAGGFPHSRGHGTVL